MNQKTPSQIWCKSTFLKMRRHDYLPFPETMVHSSGYSKNGSTCFFKKSQPRSLEIPSRVHMLLYSTQITRKPVFQILFQARKYFALLYTPISHYSFSRNLIGIVLPGKESALLPLDQIALLIFRLPARHQWTSNSNLIVRPVVLWIPRSLSWKTGTGSRKRAP